MSLVDWETVKGKLRLIKWSDFLHDNSLLLICVIQFKLSETTKPRSFTTFEAVFSWLLTIKWRGTLPLKKWDCTYRDWPMNHFAVHQLVNKSISCCREVISVENNFESSANKKQMENFVHSGRSLIKRRKRSGPKMLPWGTPLVTEQGLEMCAFIRAHCDLLQRYDEKSNQKSWSKLYIDSLLWQEIACYGLPQEWYHDEQNQKLY